VLGEQLVRSPKYRITSSTTSPASCMQPKQSSKPLQARQGKEMRKLFNP
jgi:hypothetical protein